MEFTYVGVQSLTPGLFGGGLANVSWKPRVDLTAFRVISVPDGYTNAV